MDETGMEPIRIVEVIADRVGKPRNDGTRGSALYDVPLRLSRRPDAAWADLFVRSWNSPPSFTTKHRPGIASVEGDVVWLRGTTLEEVEQTHRNTLRGVLEQTNKYHAELMARQKAEREREAKQDEAHRQHVEQTAKRIKFD